MVWDSLFVIDTATGLTQVEGEAGADTVAALVGSGSLTVDAGAKLHVKNIGWGTYYVTKDFADETLAEGSWQDLVTYDPEELGKEIHVTQDEEGNVLITAVKNESVDFPETAINNNVISVIGNADLRDPNAAGAVGFINRLVEISDEATMVETINAAGQIGAAGGLWAQNMTLVQNVMDITERHLSYEDVHFVNGEERLWNGARVWADVLGQETNGDGYGMTGGSVDYDGTNYGVILGVDLAAQNGLRWGAAFAAQKGSIDSKHSVVDTENEADAYSLTAYAAKRFGAVNVIGHLGYTHVDSEISQSFAGNIGSHKLDAGNDILTVGLKAEYRYQFADNAALVPYVGVRSVTMFSSDETSKVNGASAFKYDTDTATQFQFPIGVALQATRQSETGWLARGVIDLSITPVAGDTEVDTEVSGVGLTARDMTHAEFAGDLFGTVRMGLSAEKGNWAFGGNLGLTTGDTRQSDVTFGLNVRMKF